MEFLLEGNINKFERQDDGLGTTVEEFFGVEAQFPVKTVMPACAADSEKIPVFEQFFSCSICSQ